METVNSRYLSTVPLFLTDKNGADAVVVVVKGTWSIHDDGTLKPAEEQVPVHLVPVYQGSPGSSSLIHDTDAVLEKPGTDCILLGNAWAPKGRASTIDVTFRVGPVKKRVRVFGERIWIKCLKAMEISEPVPFERVPLVWEHSYGGTDASWPDPAGHESCLENPVGRGFLAQRSKLEIDGLMLPNLEDPACLITTPTDRPSPAGFGPIAPYWHPRARHAGTYDERWRKMRNPLPPEDLDPRFYAVAAPGLTTRHYLAGNETVMVENACRRGKMIVQLPGVKPRVTVRQGHVNQEICVDLDTVIVEPDEERVVLTWRGRCPIHGRLADVERVDVSLAAV